ncbi:MAG: TniQ family protein [Betaproteobacteria bacterium]|nr:TniQ family protein [Betaproteobacteria bacterium]
MTTRRTPLSFIPPLLPDQTLYSWVAIFHAMSGNASEEETLIQLFGSDKAGRHFHIPSHLDAFCAATQLTLGRPEQLIDTATILPAYLRFRPVDIIEDVQRRVRGNQTAGIVQSLRIARSRLYTSFAPKRVCRECAEEDRLNHGVAYWHRAHQLPGSLVCIRHGTSLYATPMDSRHKRFGGFLTPEQDLLEANQLSSSLKYSEEDKFFLNRLAILAIQMTTRPLVGGYSRSAMRQTCITALQARGLFCDDVTECALKATQDYAEHFRKIAWIPDLASALTQQSTRLLWSLLSNTQYPHHPLEYVLLIDWMYGNWEAFVSHYSAAGNIR